MRVTLSIASIELLLFFAVPFIQSDSLPPSEKRTAAEHITSGIYRMVSGLAPTESHIRTSENEMIESVRMINAIHSDSALIIIDPSADGAIARCMQVLIPGFTYAEFQPWDSTRGEVFSGKYDYPENASNILFTAKDLYVISAMKSVKVYESQCGLQPLGIGKYIAIFSIPNERREMYRQFFMQMYFIK